MFTSNKVYPRLVRELYANMEVVEVSQNVLSYSEEHCA
jgi:hypothetical protein